MQKSIHELRERQTTDGLSQRPWQVSLLRCMIALACFSVTINNISAPFRERARAKVRWFREAVTGKEEFSDKPWLRYPHWYLESLASAEEKLFEEKRSWESVGISDQDRIDGLLGYAREMWARAQSGMYVRTTEELNLRLQNIERALAQASDIQQRTKPEAPSFGFTDVGIQKGEIEKLSQKIAGWEARRNQSSPDSYE